jgi:hypothetical protein
LRVWHVEDHQRTGAICTSMEKFDKLAARSLD